jgi:hypothetical protein
MKQQTINQVKDESVKLLAVSTGFIASSLLLSIGITLILSNEYIGFLITIVGYELARQVFIFLYKNVLVKRSKL